MSLVPTAHFFKENNMHKLTAILSAIMIFFSVSVAALELDQAKQQGLVGEMANGYLGVVVQQADTEKLVADINAQRKAIYVKLAENNQITLEQVEILAGQKAYNKTQAGHYLQKDGVWLIK
jgi:uncharacterized protein YdbL (DUF1318 family)